MGHLRSQNREEWIFCERFHLLPAPTILWNKSRGDVPGELKLGLQNGQFVKVKAQQVQSLQKKLRQHAWTHESAATVLEAISGASVFSASVFNASEQKELMTAVNATDDAKKCSLRPRQEASSFKEFVTEGGVRALQDCLATAFQKIDKMPKRMVSMGLINPTEELLYTANYGFYFIF